MRTESPPPFGPRQTSTTACTSRNIAVRLGPRRSRRVSDQSDESLLLPRLAVAPSGAVTLFEHTSVGSKAWTTDASGAWPATGDALSSYAAETPTSVAFDAKEWFGRLACVRPGEEEGVPDVGVAIDHRERKVGCGDRSSGTACGDVQRLPRSAGRRF